MQTADGRNPFFSNRDVPPPIGNDPKAAFTSYSKGNAPPSTEKIGPASNPSSGISPGSGSDIPPSSGGLSASDIQTGADIFSTIMETQQNHAAGQASASSQAFNADAGALGMIWDAKAKNADLALRAWERKLQTALTASQENAATGRNNVNAAGRMLSVAAQYGAPGAAVTITTPTYTVDPNKIMKFAGGNISGVIGLDVNQLEADMMEYGIHPSQVNSGMFGGSSGGSSGTNAMMEIVGIALAVAPLFL